LRTGKKYRGKWETGAKDRPLRGMDREGGVPPKLGGGGEKTAKPR